MIPKIIHYCWLSNDEVPEKLKMCMKSWENKLSDYQFVKWDFTRFDKETSVWVKEAFENKKYAFAADYIRLYAVYHYGGIYLDMDVEVIKNFNELLNKPRMLAYENNKTLRIEAGCFGAEKNDPFILECLRHYDGLTFVKDDGTFDETVLPLIMKNTLEQFSDITEIYGEDYFTAKSFETGVISITDNTFAIHHFSGSWKTEKEQKMISEIQKLSKFTGYYIARNIIEYKYAFINKEVIQLTFKKIIKKFKR